MACQTSNFVKSAAKLAEVFVKIDKKLTILIVNKFANRHNMSELSYYFG